MIDLEATFNKYHADEYLEFDRVENKYSGRADLNALILLDKLLPGSSDIISAAGHEEVFLSVDISELAEVASEEDILTLVRCGVLYYPEYHCLFIIN